MAVQKLPKDIQFLFCASKLCSYKRAIEELIYNALDADSTSIAVRVNIEDNSMQVIDNGCGISKNDFSILGQGHATSKCVDLATLKSAPNKYGFRGLSLASIIEVSKSVTITSRFSNSEDTWAKTFYKGKEQKVCEVSQRPSKGTTVDVKGFLYNLKIQKKAIESLNELNDIKNFLEQLSLVHNNISVSLRDDAKNEIVFKLHKNRDIYQTLSSVFEIDKKDVQELKVEKGEYKVTAYIGKRDKETSQKRWIYLNGKILQNSKINKLLNDSLTKTLKLNQQTKKKVKSKNPYNQEEDLSKSGIPFYFIFITCPYYDYDLNIASKQTIVEFKHWDHINKLLDKLTKFYAGDTKVQETKQVKNDIKNIKNVENTRDEVKKIMERILGSNQRKIGVSQMQKGIKGKITKRKPKKQTAKLSLTKVIPNITMHNDLHYNLVGHNTKIDKNQFENKSEIAEQNENQNRENKSVEIKVPKIKNKNQSKTKQNIDQVIPNTTKTNVKDTKVTSKYKKLKDQEQMAIRIPKDKLKQTTKWKKLDKLSMCTKKMNKPKQNIGKNNKKKNIKIDGLLRKFKEDPTGSVKKRCRDLSKKIVKIMNSKKNRKRQVFVNETVQYSNVVKDNKKYSVRKKIGEIVIHEYIPKPIGISPSSYDASFWDKADKKSRQERENLSSYDLIRTVLKTQETKNTYTKTGHAGKEQPLNNSPYFHANPKSYYNERDTPAATVTDVPKLTYESHNYEKYINRVSHEYNFISHDDVEDAEKKVSNNIRFITTQSRDNFLIPQVKDMIRRKRKSYSNNHRFRKDCCGNLNKSKSCTSLYSIEFSKTNEDPTNFHTEQLKTKSITEPVITGTYTIEQRNTNWIENDTSLRHSGTYTIIDDTLEFGNNIRIANEHKSIHCIDQSDNRDPMNREPYTQELSNPYSMQGDYINTTEGTGRKTSECGNMDVVFVSKSQESQLFNECQLSLDGDIIPLDVCETVHSCEDIQKTQSIRKINDSLFNDDLEIDSFLCDRNAYTQQNFPDLMDLDDLILEDPINKVIDAESYDIPEPLNPEWHNKNKSIIKDDCQNTYENVKSRNNRQTETENRFNFKDRLRFVPKGMSQIFRNCQTKSSCNYSIDQENFKKEIYNKFADDVRENVKIYEPEVQNVQEVATKAVDKVKNRLSKDHASLVFDGDNLKNAKILAQIDNKFIAAKLWGRAHHSREEAEYLILFDQHAVHERIRLESILSEYLNNEQWKSSTLEDEITVKLAKDEILYLHNYKDKFSQLGLEWSILSTGEVSIKSIPDAILGKNPRQVEIVMKSVKNLIIEEINAIRAQSGCISLYPKAIMELVFSEACRYAIKFGDRLSIRDCADLLNSLAWCKTPFQCAHGRPVMAVLMELKNETKKYKTNIANISKWMKRRQK